MKKKLIALLSGLCVAVVIGALAYTHVTTAYLVDSDDKVNVAQMGSMDIEIDEDIVDYEKQNIAVKNKGTVDCYVRVMIKIPKVMDSSGNLYTAVVTLADGMKIENWDEITFIEVKGGSWRKAADGYWYYSEKVKPKDTIPFLQSIKYDGISDKADINRDQLDVVIYVEAAQADNRGEITDPKDAFDFTK